MTSPTGMGGAAEGYLFQDAVMAALLLRTLSEGQGTISAERKEVEDDPFDDILLYDLENLRIQCKNSQNHQMKKSNLRGSQPLGKSIAQFEQAAEKHRERSEDRRCIVLTSYGQPDNLTEEWRREGELKLLGELVLPTYVYGGEIGNVENPRVEFVFECPGIGTSGDHDSTTTVKDTPLYSSLVKEWRKAANSLDNPLLKDVGSSILRALNTARQARTLHAEQWSLMEIARQMRVAPGDQSLDHGTTPTPGAEIVPEWVIGVRKRIREEASRIHVVGPPGTGKSTGVEQIQGSDVVRYRLEHDQDDDRTTAQRMRLARIRHEIAGRIDTEFPEAVGEERPPIITSSLDDLNRRLAALSDWAEDNNRNPCVIIDALDYVARNDLKEARGIAATLSGLNVRTPVSLILLSRPLGDDFEETLENFERVPVQPWDRPQVQSWLEANLIPIEEDRLERIIAVSGGLPLILGHLIHRAGQESSDTRAVALDNALEGQVSARGDTQQYFSHLLSEQLSSRARDAVFLAVAHDSPIPLRTLRSCMPGAATSETITVEPGLAGVIMEGHEGVRLFHYALNDFVSSFMETEVGIAHERLYSYYEGITRETSLAADQTLHHAEATGRETEIFEWLSPNQMERWCRNGAHETQAREALRQALVVAAKQGDAGRAILAGLMSNQCQELMSIQAQETARLDFYEGMGWTDEAIQICTGIIEGGLDSSGALQAIPRLASLEGPEKALQKFEEWIREQRRDPSGSFDVDASAFLEALISCRQTDRFWEQAERWSREGPNQIASIVVELAIRYRDRSFEAQTGMPTWIEESVEEWAPKVANDINLLPRPWKAKIRTAYDAASLSSPAAAQAVVEAGATPDEVIDKLATMDVPRLERSAFDHRFSQEAYYAGAVYARAGRIEAIRGNVRNQAVEDSQLNELVALIGALTAPHLSVDGWIDIVNGAVQDVMVWAASAELHQVRSWEISHILSSAFKEGFRVAQRRLSEDALISILDQLQIDSGVELLSPLSRAVRKCRLELNPTPELVRDLKDRYQQLRFRQPDEMGPAQDLLELATEAARAGQLDLAEAIFHEAVHRGLRYGHRKDTTLMDTWGALQEAVEAPILDYRGLTIQLANWSRLVHDVTDGKETRHIEGEILDHVLRHHPSIYDAVIRLAEHPVSRLALLDYAIANRAGSTRQEWDICFNRVLLRQRGSYRDGTRRRLLALARVATDKGWDDRNSKAIHQLRYVESDFQSLGPQELEEAKERFENHGIPQPEWLKEEVKRDSSSAHEAAPPAGRDKPRGMTDEPTAMNADELTRSLIDADVRGDNVDRLLLFVEELAARGEHDQAIEHASRLISRGGCISRYYGRGFKELAGVLVEHDRENAVQRILEAWANDPIGGKPYAWGVAPNLSWLVRKVEGHRAAVSLVKEIMAWLDRSFRPFEHRVQVWGVIEAQTHP